MKMNKIDLATGVSPTTLAELLGGAGLPTEGFTPAPANDDGTDKEDCVRSTSEPIGDAPVEERRRAGIIEAIDARRAPSITPERLRFLDAMANVATETGRLPRGGNTYHLRSVLALAGVSFAAWLEQPSLREDVKRIAPLFDVGDVQASAHVRGGGPVDTLIARARRVMDEMEKNGEAVASDLYGKSRASTQAFADRMGVPRSLIFNNGTIKRDLAERIKRGALVLGAPHVDPGAPSRAERRAARSVLKTLIERYAKTGTPMPASPEHGARIDIDWLLDEAGIIDLRVRECMKCDPTFRADLAEVIRRVRIRPVHLSRIDPRVVGYGRLREEGEAMLREIYRADTPAGVPGSEAENRWVANQNSFLSRGMRVMGRVLADDAAPDFRADAFAAMILAGSTGTVKGNDAFAKGMARWARIVEAIAAATTFPASFAGALDAAMVATGRTAPSIAKALGCATSVVATWRRGGSLPTYQNFHLVATLEKELGLVPGTLAKRLPAIRSSGTMYGGRKEIILADGRVVRLSAMWRYMHPDAPTWSEDKLREHVEEAWERVYGADNAHRVRQRAVLSNAYGLPEADPTSPIWAELDDLVRFRSGTLDDGRLRDAKSEWRSDATVRLHRSHVTIFARWLMLPIEAGGIGLAPDQISFCLLLNHHLVLKYVAWRVTRAAGLAVGGEPIGPRITSTEKMILSFFSSLLDPQHGWLTQSRHVVMRPVAMPTRFRMPFIKEGKDGIVVEQGDEASEVEVMSTKLAGKLAKGKGWKKASKKAGLHIRSTATRFAKSFRLVRDPHQIVMPILEQQYPIAVCLRMARQAFEHARPLATAKRYHARDVQAVVAFLLLLIVVFRSGTMRNLTWRADGTGNLRRLPGGYEVVVGAEEFKNEANVSLFGPSWNRRDYERSIGDWGFFNEILDHYLEHCRPILLEGRQSDLLFPPPRGREDWSEHNFGHLIHGFTKKWVVWNPRFGTGMKGVRSFGPHPVRNIVATHILLNHPTEDRWRLASIVLGTGIDKVRLRYGWVTARRELAKADPLFAEASEIAASDAVLF